MGADGYAGGGMTALPAFMYRDPAQVAEANEMRELACTLCRHSAVTLMRTFCANPSNPQQKGFPWKGYRCRLFDHIETTQEPA